MDKKVVLSGIIIAVLAVAVIGSSMVGLFAAPAPGRGEVKIGFIVSQTGTQAVGGIESLNGLLLAEKKINETGGINGAKLNIVIEDDKSSEKDAVSAWRKLVDVDNVQTIIGGQISGLALAVAPLAEKEKALFLSSTATAGSLKEAGDFVFMFQAGNEAHAAKISGAMAKMGVKKLGLIYANEEYCKDFAKFLLAESTAKDIGWVAEEKYATADADARTQLLKVKSASPDAVFMCGYYEDQARVLKQARELGVSQQFFAVTTIENPKFLEIAGNAAEGIVYTSTTFSCSNENAKQFCADFSSEYGKAPSYRSAYLYDVVFVLASAMRNVGTDPPALIPELLKTDYAGVSGRVVFDTKGNAQRQFALKTVKGGKFVFLN